MWHRVILSKDDGPVSRADDSCFHGVCNVSSRSGGRFARTLVGNQHIRHRFLDDQTGVKPVSTRSDWTGLDLVLSIVRIEGPKSRHISRDYSFVHS